MKTANSAAGSNSAPRCKASLLGELNARSLAPLLRRYDLFLPGVFTLNDMTFLGALVLFKWKSPP